MDDRGREYDVILQGREDARETVTDLTNIRVRSSRTDELIPLANVVGVLLSFPLARLARVTAEQVRTLLKPRLAATGQAEVPILARGEVACQGVGVGTVYLEFTSKDSIIAET